ncbi:dUTP diphosphatase [Jeotgalibacillus soli]|uniref:dUTPase n=1 Tax=Jeotgalibacillus soli TaxID=889306 RepID=A0A0C2RPV6_9BACL|nr:dUTP diphosphatase [Jeotgalibacillus soli]KIL43794.1 hypothetical protein KP78_36180 [Jeotgalibacillus soli]
MLQWETLYFMQEKLDRFIEKEKNVKGESLFSRKIMALLVELGELANETRCFKFWSGKGPSANEVILEEYVDGIHFILSLGLERELKYIPQSSINPEADLTEQFLQTYGLIHNFAQHPTKDNYEKLWDAYLAIGKSLGFSGEDIMNAYIEKNKVNVQRQEQGY